MRRTTTTSLAAKGPASIVHLIAILALFSFSSQAFGQTINSLIDFDTTGTNFIFPFDFGGYGGFPPPMGTVSVNNDGLGPDGIRGTYDDGPDFPGNNIFSSVVIGANGNASAGIEANFDTSNFVTESGATFDFLGYGLGFGAAISSPLTSADLADINLMFDVRIEGDATPLGGFVRLNLQTVDGVLNNDGADDNVIVLETPSLSYSNTFQTFSFDLDTLTTTGGSTADLATFLSSIDRFQFQVQIEGNSGSFGTDADNNVFIDNVKISTVPEPSAIAMLAFAAGACVVLRRRS